MKQFSTILLMLLVVFLAAILYLVTKPPRDLTLKEMLSINPPPPDVRTSQEQPVRIDTTITYIVRDLVRDTVKESVRDKFRDTVKPITVEKPAICYYIIVESATNKNTAFQKAEKLKKTFKSDFIVLPLSREGYYRISKGKYLTLEEAKSAIEGIKRNIRSDAWIFSLNNGLH